MPNKRVILLKAVSEDETKNDNNAFYNVLTANGYDVSNIPPIDFNFCNINILSEKLLHPNRYSGLILTSPRAVKSISLCQDKVPPSVHSTWCTLNNYVVGEVTGTLAAVLDLHCRGQHTGNAAALADFIAECTSMKPLLYPTSTLASDSLSTKLSDAGITVETIQVYETVTHPALTAALQDAMTDEVTQWMVFFSPSGVRFVHEVLTAIDVNWDLLKIVAIGPSTEKALKELDLQVYGTCAKPNAESLLQVLSQ